MRARQARDGKLTAEGFARRDDFVEPSAPCIRCRGVWPGRTKGASERIAELGIGTLTSTYDHRIIQGAESGDFLRTIHESCCWWPGTDVFRELSIPYLPVRWSTDSPDRRQNSRHELDAGPTTAAI